MLRMQAGGGRHRTGFGVLALVVATVSVTLVAGRQRTLSRAQAASRVPRHEKRPNVLWFIAEGITPDLLPAYGDRVAHTPAIDSLARDGIRFDTVYADRCAPRPASR
jgi:hypothetical protein